MDEKKNNSPVHKKLVAKLMRERGITEEEAETIAKEREHENAIRNVALTHTEEARKKIVSTKRKKKMMAERTRFLLEATLSDTEEEIRKELLDLGFDDDDTCQMDAVNLAVLKNAKKGDVESARYLRDTSGNAPTNNMAIGNLDDKPFTQLDLSALSTEELLKMLEDTKE